MIESKEFYSGKIIDLVTTESGFDIKNTTRKRDYVEARALCYTLLRDHLNMSYCLIGYNFDKTHASILHAVNNFPYMMKFNPALKTLYFDINRQIEDMKEDLTPLEKREYSLMDEIVKLKQENMALKKKIKDNKI
jgi:hypothetical protein